MGNKDLVEKTLEGYNDVFADIVNVLLFGGRRIVREEELVDAGPRSYYKADGKIREQERDVSKYWQKNNIRIAFVGMENQTSENKDMPIRVIGYDGAAYRNQMKKESPERYPVVTLVLYFGYEGHWKAPLHLLECFDIPEPLRPYVSDYRINLFEIAYLTREQVELFQSDFKIVADYFVQMRENRDFVPTRETIQHVQEVLQLMAVMTEDTRFEEAYNEEGSGTNMCEFLDRVEARGITIGEARGEARGEVKGTVATCRRFGLDDTQILNEITTQFHLEKEEAMKYLA